MADNFRAAKLAIGVCLDVRLLPDMRMHLASRSAPARRPELGSPSTSWWTFAQPPWDGRQFHRRLLSKEVGRWLWTKAEMLY